MGRLKTNTGAGRVIGGKYELVEEAGKGGMAIVWRAIVRGAGGFTRTVAVKQMHPHLADTPRYVDMFFEEARIGSTLNDPNIPQVYDCVEDGGEYFLIMEWVEGIDLGGYLRYCRERDRNPRWEIVTAVGIGMLRGLAAAHERRGHDGLIAPVVHRDVSPHNVLLSVKGQVKLIDFGLSLAQDRGRETTEPGVIKGKMAYLSPGVVAGERPTPATDQFAVGTVLWESLVGRRLFQGENDFEVYKKIREAQVPPLRTLRGDLPPTVVTVVTRALSARVTDRYKSVRDMAHQLSIALKSSKSRSDLHQLMAQEVNDAREYLRIGRMTHDPAESTPVADLDEHTPVEGKRGLLHWLPFFGKK